MMSCNSSILIQRWRLVSYIVRFEVANGARELWLTSGSGFTEYLVSINNWLENNYYGAVLTWWPHVCLSSIGHCAHSAFKHLFKISITISLAEWDWVVCLLNDVVSNSEISGLNWRDIITNYKQIRNNLEICDLSLCEWIRVRELRKIRNS
jgi:hypothetical protein